MFSIPTSLPLGIFLLIHPAAASRGSSPIFIAHHPKPITICQQTIPTIPHFHLSLLKTSIAPSAKKGTTTIDLFPPPHIPIVNMLTTNTTPPITKNRRLDSPLTIHPPPPAIPTAYIHPNICPNSSPNKKFIQCFPKTKLEASATLVTNTDFNQVSHCPPFPINTTSGIPKHINITTAITAPPASSLHLLALSKVNIHQPAPIRANKKIMLILIVITITATTAAHHQFFRLGSSAYTNIL